MDHRTGRGAAGNAGRVLLTVAFLAAWLTGGLVATHWLDRPPPPVFTGPMLAGPPNYVVTAYQKVVGPFARAWVLDPRSGTYRQTPYASVLLSPDGGRALVQRKYVDRADWLVISRDDLLAGRTGPGRPLPAPPGAQAPAWTPDSMIFQPWDARRAGEVVAGPSLAPAGFRLVDPVTLRPTTTVELPPGPYSEPGDLADIALGPLGRFALVIGDGPRYGEQQVWLFDFHGRLVRTLRTAVPARGDSTTRPLPSPDGRYVQAPDGQHVLDLLTGQALPPGDGLVLGGLRSVGWYDSTRCILQVPDPLLGRLLVLDVVTGQVVESIPIPNDIGIGTVSVGRLSDYGPQPGPLVL
jgi:hypothetical protein